MDIVPRQKTSPTPRPSGTTPALENTPVDDNILSHDNLKKYNLSGLLSGLLWKEDWLLFPKDQWGFRISDKLIGVW